MISYPTLACQPRTVLGSNAARKMRRLGQLPAGIFGHGPAQSLTLATRDFAAVERSGASGAQIVRLTIDGQDAGLALVKGVQRHITNGTPTHLELQRISAQEGLQVPVSVVLTGDPIGVTRGGLLEVVQHTVTLRCAADAIPGNVQHDISGMDIGDMLLSGQLILPAGCALVADDELIVVVRRLAGTVAPTAEPAA